MEQAALRMLAGREHTREELRRKLVARGYDEEAIEQLLIDLESRNYLNDERFIESYIESRQQKGFGPLRISLELQQRGIARSQIDQWLDEEDGQWRELLKETAIREFGPDRPTCAKEKARQGRFFEYRGFPSELIRELLWWE